MGQRATIVGARIGGTPDDPGWVLKQMIKPFDDVEIITSLAFEAAVGALKPGLGTTSPSLAGPERAGSPGR